MPRLKMIAPAALSAALLLLLPACESDRASSTQHETAGQYVDDATITTKVKAELLKDQELKSCDIHVKTDKGVVILSGVVDDRVQKNDATRIARSISNVRDVVNDISTRR